MKHVLFYILLTFLLTSIPSFAQNAETMGSSSIEVVNLESDEVKIYPNPASTHVTIKVENDKLIKQITLYSILGNTVLDMSVASKSQIKLNLADIKKGKYLIKITFDDNSSQVKSLIKN